MAARGQHFRENERRPWSNVFAVILFLWGFLLPGVADAQTTIEAQRAEWAKVADFIWTYRLIQNTCHVFGPAAQAAIDAYETGNYQSLGTTPDDAAKVEKTKNYQQAKKQALFNGACVFSKQEQLGIMKIYGIIDQLSQGYFTSISSQRQRQGASKEIIDSIINRGSAIHDALTLEAPTVSNAMILSESGYKEQLDKAQAISDATKGASMQLPITTDILIFYHDGGKFTRNLDGHLVQASPAKVCLSGYSEIFAGLKLLQDQKPWVDEAKTKAEIYAWARVITTLSQIFDERHISVYDWVQDQTASVTNWNGICDLLLIRNDDSLHAGDRYNADAVQIWATTPHLEPIKFSELAKKWLLIDQAAANAQKKKQDALADAKIGKLPGLGFLYVSESANMCVEPSADAALIIAAYQLKQREFPAFKPVGSLVSGSAEESFTNLKHRACGYYAGSSPESMQKIITALDRDALSSGLSMVLANEDDLAAARLQIVANEKAAAVAEQQAKADAENSASLERKRQDEISQCRADHACAAQREASLVAVLTCKGYGQQMAVSFCLGGSNTELHGELSIRMNGRTRAYAPSELQTEFGSTSVRIPLDASFEIVTQNGGSDAVLDLTIVNGFNDLLYQDSASSYHVIRYNH